MNFEYAGIPLATVLSVFLEVLKQNGYVRKETIPLVSILLGLISGVVMFSEGDIKAGVVKGLYLGLMPMGLYEGFDSIKE